MIPLICTFQLKFKAVLFPSRGASRRGRTRLPESRQRPGSPRPTAAVEVEPPRGHAGEEIRGPKSEEEPARAWQPMRKGDNDSIRKIGADSPRGCWRINCFGWSS